MSKSRQRPVRALIIDDSISDVLLLRDALDFHSFEVNLDVIHDGETALRMIDTFRRSMESPADLIILDLNLPKVDGFEILEFLKNDAHLRTVPVIVMSSSSAEQDVCRSYFLGANAYVVKPVSLGEVMSTIRALCEFWFRTARLVKDTNGVVPYAPERGHSFG